MKLFQFACAVVFGVLLSASLVFAADASVDLKFTNKTGKSVVIQVKLETMEKDRTIEKTVDDGGTVEFTKAETLLKGSDFPAGWEVTYTFPNGTCKQMMGADCSAGAGWCDKQPLWWQSAGTCAYTIQIGGNEP